MKQSDVDAAYRQSVLSLGRVVEPSICRKTKAGKYTLMSSPAPWFTAQLFQIDSIPVFVLSDDYANYTPYRSGSNLNPIEIAELNKKMMESQDLSITELASELEVSPSKVSHTQRLLKLSEPIKKALRDGTVTESFARRFASFPKAKQTSLFEKFTKIDRPKNIRELEKRLALERESVSSGNASPTLNDPDTARLEKKLSEYLGSAVRFKNGSMVIDYLNNNEILEGLLDRMDLPSA